MFGRVLNPAHYGWLGMRENTYLVALLILLAMVLTYWVQHVLAPALRRHTLPWLLLESTSLAALVALVFVFLRPIRQFIYFQF